MSVYIKYRYSFFCCRIVGDDDGGVMFTPEQYEAYKKKVLPMVGLIVVNIFLNTLVAELKNLNLKTALHHVRELLMSYLILVLYCLSIYSLDKNIFFS